jgi:transketolase
MVETLDGAPSELEDMIQLIRDKARWARLETVRLISIAKTGHYASGFSCAEILATLYYGVMNIRPEQPAWSDRDRFLFGKGHAAATLYPLLADLGFFAAAELEEYTRLGSAFGDHPDMRRIPGIDFSSGSLGHALSVGTGIALAGRIHQLDYTTFVLLGDGELHEGQVWEAAMSAAHHGLGSLVAIVDRNDYTLDGQIDGVTSIEPLGDKWRSFGWDAYEVDGHDVDSLLPLLRSLQQNPTRRRPAAVVARTVKGKGVSFMEAEFGWHLGWLAPHDERKAIAELRASS